MWTRGIKRSPSSLSKAIDAGSLAGTSRNINSLQIIYLQLMKHANVWNFIYDVNRDSELLLDLTDCVFTLYYFEMLTVERL